MIWYKIILQTALTTKWDFWNSKRIWEQYWQTNTFAKKFYVYLLQL